jgi:hypothetical protein
MRKAILGLAAVGAVIGLAPVLKRRIGHKLREHCDEMAAKSKRMMAGQPGARGEEEVGTQAHGEQMPARVDDRRAAVA